MNRTFLATTVFASLSCFSSTCVAHPGHAVEIVSSQSAWHLWLQPEHGILGIVAAGVFVLAVRTCRSWLISRELHGERLV